MEALKERSGGFTLGFMLWETLISLANIIDGGVKENITEDPEQERFILQGG